MAQPVPETARDHAEPPSRPCHPNWNNVRAAIITEARAARLAVEEMADRPGDDRAVEMAAAILTVLEHLGELAGRWGFDEARLEAIVAERVKDALADRSRRLRALPPPG